ncbi:hypothetical protein L2E82_40631 [Cichorium intybus]|uniref:Uncharacterized protein n=1 Tax=Cichorium intybus TaxID=13427 RepID=A0ACB9AL04_CICIN|nr:hypothetical protein L2E82_40631 [Cichorium intybus]
MESSFWQMLFLSLKNQNSKLGRSHYNSLHSSCHLILLLNDQKHLHHYVPIIILTWRTPETASGVAQSRRTVRKSPADVGDGEVLTDEGQEGARGKVQEPKLLSSILGLLSLLLISSDFKFQSQLDF